MSIIKNYRRDFFQRVHKVINFHIIKHLPYTNMSMGFVREGFCLFRDAPIAQWGAQIVQWGPLIAHSIA